MSDTKFTARNERVYNGEKMIASIWAEYPSKDCLPGESWMQMMERTEGAREKATQDTFDRARLFAAAQDLYEAAQAAMQCIGELSPTQARVEVAQLLQSALRKATGEQQ